MPKAIVPRYFACSVLILLLVLVAYVFSEARRFRQELLRQTEAKAAALADAMESNIRSSIAANGLLEDVITQRLMDNARLIDELLRFPLVDQKFIQQIAAANGLKKIELLDPSGQPLGPVLPAQQRREEMMARMGKGYMEQAPEQHRAMMTFMWGRQWRSPADEGQPPAKLAQRKFWEGSVFGVAIGAKSFAGIIAVHADADYILQFRKQMDMQRQIDELGRQSDIEHAALLDNSGKILAHTDGRLVDRISTDPLFQEAKSSRRALGRVIEGPGGRHFDLIKPIAVNETPSGFLEVGLSLAPVESAWQRSVHSMIVAGAAVLLIGILGMAAISYLQHAHLQKIRLLEAEIGRQQRLSELGNMAANVAHEIRNPLNSVSMGLQRLKGEFTPTEDRAEYARFLNLMQSEVQRLNSIVEQFLSLARPLKLEPEKLPVDALLSDLKALLAGEANAANVKIAIEVPPNLSELEADRNTFKQLMLNLMLNALHAMPGGGTLTVQVKPDKDSLELSVADEGTGMDAETVKQIFEPYFTTKATGSGLGLAIARRIVEAHAGSIRVDSAPGKGSRFLIRLPFKSAER